MPNVKFMYNQSINGIKDARIKGLGAEVSSLIEEGLSDSRAKKSAIPYLFNETKSDKAIERHAVEDGYDLMDPTVDGDKAKTDKSNQIGEKLISHVIYTKNVIVTETMMEDAYYKMDPSLELKARALPDSYWRTRETVAQNAYINGENAKYTYRGAEIDLTTYDGKPLFSSEHTWGDTASDNHGTQSNLYYVELPENYTAGDIAKVLSAGASVINQMLNANGEAQDFDADTVLVPRGVKTNAFVDMVRRAIGSEYFPGTGDNDINTQHGAWDFVPLSYWKPETPEIMIMSQEAKKMNKSMFYNRVTLGINVWREDATGNLNWRARTRFGLGHVDYKHVVKIKFIKQGEEAPSGATLLEI